MSNAKTQIMVVDDEPSVRRFLDASLSAHGFEVALAGSISECLTLLATGEPNLIILDLGLPDMDGLDAVEMLRERTRAPIIILSVREYESDKVTALDRGADDYVTKPFGLSELLARMRVALRHAQGEAAATVFTIDDLVVDVTLRSVTVGRAEIQLTPTEYSLLRVLASEAGRVLTHRQLLRGVWGPGYEHEMHLLRVNMSNLRRKIEPDPNQPHYIRTEPGVGYRLRASS